jgi:hypothetical protein
MISRSWCWKLPATSSRCRFHKIVARRACTVRQSITALRRRSRSQTGGDTVWANTVAACDGLPPVLNRLSEHLWAVHARRGTIEIVRRPDRRPRASGMRTELKETRPPTGQPRRGTWIRTGPRRNAAVITSAIGPPPVRGPHRTRATSPPRSEPKSSRLSQGSALRGLTALTSISRLGPLCPAQYALFLFQARSSQSSRAGADMTTSWSASRS